MILKNQNYALLVAIDFKARTPLMIRSGQEGEVSDSSLKRTPDGRLHINGYVWASLIRRAMSRCEAGKGFAEAWGKYEAKAHGVAPLWTTPTFISPSGFIPDINYGNRIDRDFGSVADEALYSDEIALVHERIPCRFKVYLESQVEVESAKQALAEALWVINQGIETIGGGWSYGMGRLKSPDEFKCRRIDLSNSDDLWEYEPDETTWDPPVIRSKSPVGIAEGRNWSRFTVSASILPGQLLAIHSTVPPLDYEGDVQPDTFVYCRPKYIDEVKYVSEKIVTGKSFRQAILSQEIERELRSTGGIGACLNSSDGKRTPKEIDTSKKRLCLCRRCLWFGDTSGGGIISVADAAVEGADVQIIWRQQLCEHSNQNVQLFNGEYLTKGNFTFDILIDHSRPNCSPDKLETAVKRVLAGMMPEDDSKDVREKRWLPPTVNEELIEPEFFAPEGWCRLGATSSCTGQLSVKKVEVKGVHHV